jgi:hypothetical protein
MAKVLVSLVSEQTIPNVEFIKEHKNHFDRFLFITTEFMEKPGKTRTICILNGANISEVEPEIIKVKEDSISDIFRQLDLKINKEDDFIINLTGGTKMMSLAVYLYFKDITEKIYYKPIRSDLIRSVSNDEIYKAVKTQITVFDYLNSYGVKSKAKSEFQKSNITIEIFNSYLEGSIDFNIIELLRINYRSNKDIYRIKSIEQTFDDGLRIENLAEFMNHLGFNNKTDEDSIITKEEINFLTGGWYEEFTYNLIKEKLGLDDEHIKLGVNLEKSDYVLNNDLDVVFTFNNNLYVVECKTAMSINEKISTSLFNETIYKASALRAKFGLNVKNLLFTLSNMTHPNIDYVDRAKVMNIDLYERKFFIDLSKLNDLFENIKKTF